MDPISSGYIELSECLSTDLNKSISSLPEMYSSHGATRERFSTTELPKELEKNKYSTLVPLYYPDGPTTIRVARSTQDDSDYPDIMPLHGPNRRPVHSAAVVSSLEDFQRNLSAFTGYALEDLSSTANRLSAGAESTAWENIVVAGSAVVASLLPTPEGLEGQGDLQRFYHNKFPPHLNVDLFLHGLHSKEEADAKTAAVIKSIGSAVYPSTGLVQTENAVTIVSKVPTRHVRIVQTMFRTPGEILASFDVDCSCVLYDGQQVYASPRAIIAFVSQTNRIDLTYRFARYESRLFRYSCLGFGICLPNVDRAHIDPNIFDRLPNPNGLAPLLVLELHGSKNRHIAYVMRRRSALFLPPTACDSIECIEQFWDETAPEWEISDKRLGYTTDVIPYGKNWDAKRIIDHLGNRSLGVSGLDVPGLVDKILKTWEPSIAKGRDQIAAGRSEKEWAPWTQTPYTSGSDYVCHVIWSNNLHDVKHYFCDPIQIHHTDYIGREPIHLACMKPSSEITSKIIDHLVKMGAQLTTKTSDGKTVFHLAAARGDLGTLEALRKHHDRQSEPDVINATSNTFVSALHLAILFNHYDTVKHLVEWFNADVNLPLKIRDGEKGETVGAIPSLALCLHLPPDDATEMWTRLVSLGADQSWELLLHYIVQSGNIEIFKIFKSSFLATRPDVATSAMGALRRIQAFSLPPDKIVNGCHQRGVVSSALTVAIAAGDEKMALAVLEAGADPSIPDPDGSLLADQPIYMAIERNMPSLAIQLLSQGATVNHTDELLHMVDEQVEKLSKLRERHNAARVAVSVPTRKRQPATKLLEGSYRNFLTGLEVAKQWQDYFAEAATILRSEEIDASAGDPTDLIKVYQTLQDSLYNAATKNDRPKTTLGSYTTEPEQRHSMSDDTTSAVKSIFEAAWEGDLNVILRGKDNLEKRDQSGFTCLALAALRNLDVAKQIVNHIFETYDDGHNVVLEQLQEQYHIHCLIESKLPRKSSTVWAGSRFSLQEEIDRFEVNTLSGYAIVEGNCKLLRFLMSVYHQASPTGLNRPDPALRAEMALAISLNRLECMKTIIEETGIGGVVSHSPVAGAAVRGPGDSENAAQDYSGIAEQDHPLLIAAQEGNDDKIVWVLNGGADSHYLCYAHNHLQKQEALCSLPEATKRLILHYAVMSQPSEHTENLLQTLVETYPQYLEERAFGGRTPLALACFLRKAGFAQVLKDKGAETQVLDDQGRNLLHLLLFSNTVCKWTREINSILSLLGEAEVLKMLNQTTRVGSMTPFALWVHAYTTFEDGDGGDTDIPEYIMSLRSTSHFATLDAFGNTPIHTSVGNGLYSVLEPILPHCQDLLDRENVAGVTPIELAQNQLVESVATNWIDRTLWDLYRRERFEPQRETSLRRSVWALCSRHHNGNGDRRVATELKEMQTAVSLTSEMTGESVAEVMEAFCGDKIFWDGISRW